MGPQGMTPTFLSEKGGSVPWYFSSLLSVPSSSAHYKGDAGTWAQGGTQKDLRGAEKGMKSPAWELPA